jgi:hypothetical protein
LNPQNTAGRKKLQLVSFSGWAGFSAILHILLRVGAASPSMGWG